MPRTLGEQEPEVPTETQTETTREKVKRLYDAGLTPQDIAKLLGHTTQNVYKHCKALGITFPKRGAA